MFAFIIAVIAVFVAVVVAAVIDPRANRSGGGGDDWTPLAA
jgi:hypothetical protein